MKKIAIFGATGMTGLCTVEAALNLGKMAQERQKFVFTVLDTKVILNIVT